MVTVHDVGGQSRLDGLRQSGSLRILFPRPAHPPTAMLLNTAGGVSGGDTFDITAAAQSGAKLTVTTQAAERIYAAPPGPPGHVRNTLHVACGAKMHWLPQETILFENSALNRSLDVTLENDAELLAVETLVFGRLSAGETLRQISLRDRIRLHQNGRPLFHDSIHLSGDATHHLTHRAIAGGAGALATLILTGPRAEAQLAPLRQICAEKSGTPAGVSLIRPEVLVLRALAPDSFDMRRLLLPVLDHLTRDTLPVCWRL